MLKRLNAGAVPVGALRAAIAAAPLALVAAVMPAAHAESDYDTPPAESGSMNSSVQLNEPLPGCLRAVPWDDFFLAHVTVYNECDRTYRFRIVWEGATDSQCITLRPG